MSNLKDSGKGRMLPIELNKGDFAPRYEKSEWGELSIDKAIVTEQGTMGKLPIVDLQLTDEKGKKYFAMITGRLIIGLGDACKGVMLRVHGNETPNVD